jgi:lysozyme family protein
MRYSIKWPQYTKQWDSMKVGAGPKGSASLAEFNRVADFAIAHKDTYQQIERLTGVPWEIVACIHKRESDADKNDNPRFDTYLGNGQPLNRRTTIVPKGRGPFKSFADGAADAFKIDGLNSVIDWRLEKGLYYSEILNGAGYDIRGLPSPYLWAGTNIQKPGKYVGDGQWNGRFIDPQIGVAGMLYTIMQKDKTIILPRET